MADNPLLNRSAPATKMRAIDWHRIAVDKGLRIAAAAWWQEALARGEVNADGRTRAAGD
jgi:hypothetical protein